MRLGRTSATELRQDKPRNKKRSGHFLTVNQFELWGSAHVSTHASCPALSHAQGYFKAKLSAHYTGKPKLCAFSRKNLCAAHFCEPCTTANQPLHCGKTALPQNNNSAAPTQVIPKSGPRCGGCGPAAMRACKATYGLFQLVLRAAALAQPTCYSAVLLLSLWGLTKPLGVEFVVLAISL